MKVLDFLIRLRKHDVKVWAEGDQLRCNAPAGALTPELRRELREHKSAILEFLRSAEALAQQQRALVPLQPRGTNIPIFAVAGHNGDVFCFRALAQHLGADQPFFGLQPPGLDGNREPLTSVEKLAAYFAAQIRTYNANGPYAVAGYCAGGTIALELAQQLLRDGAEIRLLALFGSAFPTWYRPLSQWRERLRQTAERVARHGRALASLPAAERRAYIAERLSNLKAERAAEHQATPDPVMVWRDQVGRATLAAIRHYAPRPFPGRMSLFWPHQEWRQAGDSLDRWLSLSECPGKYFGPDGCDGATMLREPHAAAFARLLKSSLQGMENRSPALPEQSAAAAPRWKAGQMEALPH